MYIKSIVLDGFKSYGQRTEVNGFDREFNAITGLNGTGKSNILDSICFVLGITNLSQVRAAHLQDLVYKNGQTGITKATVSITFDNKDKNQCPPGYSDFEEIVVTRQVVIGGKNKYMINGSNAQNKRVQDLFCSVQLNVNNPNFLIMQGRITKVLNMKPVEILAMIEEAAGTRMYETKRQECNKQIARRELKLEELRNIMINEILPKLKKLKDERQQYIDFQRLERELEHFNRLWIAWRSIDLHNENAKVRTQFQELQTDIGNKETTIEKNLTEIENIQTTVEEMNAIIDRESGGKLSQLEATLKEHEKREAKSAAEVKATKSAITQEEKKIKQLEKSLKDDESALKTKEAEMGKVDGVFKILKDNEATDAAALEAAQKRFEAASAGMVVGEDGEAATLQEQIMSAKQEETEAGVRVKQSEMELKRSVAQLSEKQQELRGSAGALAKDQQLLKNMENNVKNNEKKLNSLGFNEERARFVANRRAELSSRVRTLRGRVERFEAQHPRVAFRYKDPQPNFDRRKVHGLVCKLFNVVDPIYCTALETAAGGRLYNVIVDTDTTSKLILRNGNLQQRTTIIPLNKIQSSVIDPRIVQTAENLVGSDSVQPALALINFKPELRVAMEYIYGGVFVCKSMAVATKVAFHPQIHCRCVTLDGDTVDPAGILSGGAPGRAGSMLTVLNELKGEMNELEECENELRSLEAESQRMAPAVDKYNELKQQVDLNKHELQMLRDRLQHTSHYQKQEEVEQLQSSINELKKTIEECSKRQNACHKKAAALEAQIADAKGYRERQLKDAQNDMKRLKKKAEESRNEWKKREQEFETLNLEISELRKAIEQSIDQIASNKTSIEEAQKSYTTLEKEHSEIHEQVTKIATEVKEAKNEIASRTSEMRQNMQKKKKLETKNDECKLEIQKLSLKLTKMESEIKECEQREEQLYSQNKWLKNDERYMSEARALDDQESKELGHNIQRMKETHAKQSRNVNANAISLLENEEKQYKSLLNREKVIEADKRTLKNVIVDLDQKKEKAIQIAWQQVNKDFGSIFSTLLPGANAKLQTLPGKSVVDGLEVKVSFGGVWQEGLGALSGGQRSLIALSMILSMLLFKPAPLYILDEVDAALDLSHTQNIGNMLKTHFKHSQFIIVSLKDGMFNNANVLFRTRFQDGHSGVVRTVCNQTNR